MFLAADADSKPWPIKVEVNGEPREVVLNVGDMMIYRGCEVPHWRDQFDGRASIHAFLHFVDANGPYCGQAYDGRSGLGAPQLQNKPQDLNDAVLQQDLIKKAVKAKNSN